MTQKTLKPQKVVKESGDEHELLQQDNFAWLAEFRDMLSPYWVARLEYNPEKKSHVLELDRTRPTRR